jgi:hypothetical protein
MNRVLVSLLLFSINILKADLLYSQIPDTLTAIGYRCQLDSVFPLEADIVDDITPTGNGWRIDSVVAWFCNWGGFTSWNNIPNIHFLVYEDSTDQPVDSPIVELIIEQSEYDAYFVNGTNITRWRVEVRLPTPVVLDTFRYWIEVQPSGSYLYGYTGNMAQVGIGNGQEFYFRLPEAGIPSWIDATQQFGQPLETGFILTGIESAITEKPVNRSINYPELGATIIKGPLQPLNGQKYKIFDITGRQIHTLNPASGIYFLQTDDKITEKIIKIKISTIVSRTVFSNLERVIVHSLISWVLTWVAPSSCFQRRCTLQAFSRSTFPLSWPC